MMPGWLRALSVINPLTYQVDLLRALMIHGGQNVLSLGFDFGIQFLILALLGFAAKLYPGIIT